ncbi:tetratricopeptide repeat protein [Clostridium chauvoei]|uniref:Tetratricopeptide repeat protein n=2 Tax=Clostridium chauvoei TaxID=46867 RepID=A0A1U6JGX2_9CLOT|nr:hypothetical protein [Clostridium chauvoei]ATD55392.1 hypothetical protein BTM20_09125 [Clostridium chauvoei]ATD56937.1 hypothetical protein BTM21_03920 [Clostridium chauvoei]MBX7280779.1 hypothetical protein [Clostridium chauvoei]MBX7283263.1 hypothetical protein [Clostridium chauvoei]MBX7285853.1 hypothetical protein [Clostridium chauvoei]
MKSFIKKVSSSYKYIYNKFPYIEPILVISLSIMIVLSIILTIKGQSEGNDTTFTKNIAEELFYKGEYDKAIEEFKILQKDEGWPSWNVKIAEIYSLKGDRDRSNTILKESVVKRDKIIKEKGLKEYQDKDSKLMNNVILTFLMNNEKEEALTLGESHLQDYINDKQMLKTMTAVYMANSKYNKAEEMVDTYILNNKEAYDYSTAAEMYMFINKFDKGIDALSKAWALNSNDVSIYKVIYQIPQCDRKTIIEKLNKLSKENPNEIKYKIWLAQGYLGNEEVNKAEKILDKLEDEENNNLRLLKVEVYNKTKKQKEMKETIDEIIEQDKESYVSDAILSWEYYIEGQYDKSFELAKKSIVKNGDCAEIYGLLIPKIMIKKGDIKLAEPYLRTAIEKEPFNYNIMNSIADYYSSVSIDKEKAKNIYNISLAMKNNDSEATYNLANLYIAENNIKEAMNSIKKAINISDGVGKYHRMLGALYLEKELFEEGMEEIRLAYSMDENDMLALNNAACYYFAVEGDIERGMDNMQEAYDNLIKISRIDMQKSLTENYNKAKKIYDRYQNGNEPQIEIDEFILFY